MPAHPQLICIPTYTASIRTYLSTCIISGRRIVLQGYSYIRLQKISWTEKRSQNFHEDTHGGSNHQSFLLGQPSGLYTPASMSAHVQMNPGDTQLWKSQAVLMESGSNSQRHYGDTNVRKQDQRIIWGRWVEGHAGPEGSQFNIAEKQGHQEIQWDMMSRDMNYGEPSLALSVIDSTAFSVLKQQMPQTTDA